MSSAVIGTNFLLIFSLDEFSSFQTEKMMRLIGDKEKVYRGIYKLTIL